MWKDRKAYIIRARELIRSVEQLIRDEVQQGRHPDLDAAWDTRSLVDEYGNEPDET